MRYRRLSYRYAAIVTSGQPSLFGDPWRLRRLEFQLAQSRWRPPADVYETPSSIAIRVELAGVDQDELEVLLFEDALVIEGRRRLPVVEPGGIYHTAEIRQGPFRIQIPLPAPVDAEQVDAQYDRGILAITLAKATGR